MSAEKIERGQSTFAGGISRCFAFVSAEFVLACVVCPRFVSHIVRGGFVTVDPSVRRLGHPVAGRLIPWRRVYCALAENMP